MSRIVEVIDIREFNHGDFRFYISNDGRLFGVDSSKSGFIDKIDSIQYFRNAGIILTAKSNKDDIIHNSLEEVWEGNSFVPGIALSGSEVDSASKENFQVYRSTDYDVNGKPLFGEQIPDWPLYYYANLEEGRKIPIYFSEEDERGGSGLEAYFYGDIDIFTVYKSSYKDSKIQVEQVISLFESHILVQFKLTNYGTTLEDANFSFVIDPDITHSDKIFDDIFNDSVYNSESLLITYDENIFSDSYKFAIANLHSTEFDENGNVIHPYLGKQSDLELVNTSASLELNSLVQNYSDIRVIQNTSNSNENYGDLRIFFNSERFNLGYGESVVFAYDILFDNSNDSIELLELSFNNSALQNLLQLQNTITKVEDYDFSNLKRENFDIYDLLGNEISKKANSFHNLKAGLYLIHYPKLGKVKKILVE